MDEGDMQKELGMTKSGISRMAVIAAVLLTSLVAAAEPGIEMLPNGDFEAGVSDWIPWHCKGAGAVGVVYSSSTSD
jgi:hypothetical protein